MANFVKNDSIVREIWGKADTILFVFAGAAAEFALNKAVDWLFYTGRLPADPLGRLFSTVDYARRIVFSEYDAAMQAIDQITAIHQGVEKSRGAQIPDWAYRDVLFMLIDYSIRAFELLERKLSISEKEEVFATFYAMGERMYIPGLPASYSKWLPMRDKHLMENLLYSDFSQDLYRQYRKHLGPFRYQLLKQVQIMVVPATVNRLLALGDFKLIKPVIAMYKVSRLFKLDGLLKSILLPAAYKEQIRGLDVKHS